MARAEGETFGDDGRQDVRVHENGAERILETAHDDRFIDEAVLAAAQPPELRRHRRPTAARLRRHQQDLEIGSVLVTPGDDARQHLGEVLRLAGRLALRLLGEGIGQYGVGNPTRDRGGRGGISGAQPVMQP